MSTPYYRLSPEKLLSALDAEGVAERAYNDGWSTSDDLCELEELLREYLTDAIGNTSVADFADLFPDRCGCGMGDAPDAIADATNDATEHVLRYVEGEVAALEGAE